MNKVIRSYPELAYWLALSRVPEIGPVTFIKIINRFPVLAELFTLLPEELRAYGFKEGPIQHILNPDWNSVERDLCWAEQAGNHIITYNDMIYPKLLREAHAAPPVIYVKGQLCALNTHQLAMVGSRHPTTMGSDIAHQFAKEFAIKNITITSGLALGIDGVSHQGALAGKGLTIAVLGSGLNNIYPYRHRELAEKITVQGALISEFPPDTKPLAEHFPRRNRIISGLAMGVIVVEAALQSGSLITAKYALEQGREIFAVPGSIHNTLAKGCHALIKQGAKLVETSTDVIEELRAFSPFLTPHNETNQPSPLDLAELDTHYKKLVECVGYATTPMDVIIHRIGLPVETVSSMVLMLELQGYLRAANGGYIRL